MFLNQGVCAFMELSYFDDFGQIFSQYLETLNILLTFLSINFVNSCIEPLLGLDIDIFVFSCSCFEHLGH